MQKLNKPRAFLSHSKKDKEFIEKLASDLRRCQIDCWLDTEEIRAGKSWLKVIFEDGIPTCDIVVVYLTENSITSKMVEKEIDASLIEQLSERGIAFLPYVNSAEIREQLRADIRVLQCLEWNTINYNEILPTVVAEIWHSYLERTVGIAISQEKNRRLELELEVKKQKDLIEDSPFPLSEQTDFKYIYRVMSKPLKIIFDLRDDKGLVGKDVFQVPYCESLIYYLNQGIYEFDVGSYAYVLERFLETKGFPQELNMRKLTYGNSKVEHNIVMDLRTFGLTETVRKESGFGIRRTIDKFSEKVYRFNYWLGYNNLIRENLDIQHLEFRDAESQNKK